MHLTQGKVVKAETQFRGDIRIWVLLVRQGNIQADGLGSRGSEAQVVKFLTPTVA